MSQSLAGANSGLTKLWKSALTGVSLCPMELNSRRTTLDGKMEPRVGKMDCEKNCLLGTGKESDL